MPSKNSKLGEESSSIWLDLSLRNDSEENIVAVTGRRDGAANMNEVELVKFAADSQPIISDNKAREAQKLLSWRQAYSGSQTIDPAAVPQPQNDPPMYEMSELEQYDRMLSWMIGTYFLCLGFGWGLLLLDYLWNKVERRPKAEPWITDVVIIGGASAVLSPIIQWSHTILQTKKTDNQMTEKRLFFLRRMLALYVSMVSGSVLVAAIRFSLNEDGSLHHFIATTSNHLVLARISASLLSWGAGKLFIRWYAQRLSAGPLF